MSAVLCQEGRAVKTRWIANGKQPLVPVQTIAPSLDESCEATSESTGLVRPSESSSEQSEQSKPLLILCKKMGPVKEKWSGLPKAKVAVPVAGLLIVLSIVYLILTNGGCGDFRDCTTSQATPPPPPPPAPPPQSVSCGAHGTATTSADGPWVELTQYGETCQSRGFAEIADEQECLAAINAYAYWNSKKQNEILFTPEDNPMPRCYLYYGNSAFSAGSDPASGVGSTPGRWTAATNVYCRAPCACTDDYVGPYCEFPPYYTVTVESTDMEGGGGEYVGRYDRLDGNYGLGERICNGKPVYEVDNWGAFEDFDLFQPDHSDGWTIAYLMVNDGRARDSDHHPYRNAGRFDCDYQEGGPFVDASENGYAWSPDGEECQTPADCSQLSNEHTRYIVTAP